MQSRNVPQFLMSVSTGYTRGAETKLVSKNHPLYVILHANPTATAVLDRGEVASVTLTHPPTSNNALLHSSAPAVSFSGGGGSNAAGTAVLTNGIVTSITMTNNGSGYSSAPTVTLGLPPTTQLTSIRLVETLNIGDKGADVYLDSITLYNGILADSIDNSILHMKATLQGGIDGTITSIGNIPDNVFMLANTNTVAQTQSFHSNLKYNYLMHLNSGIYHSLSVSLTNKAGASVLSSTGSGQQCLLAFLVVDRD